MVRIGLSDVIGSWKIIEMSRPRILRISSSSSVSKLRPSKLMRPLRDARRYGRGSSRMIESAETDLPEPDSPTMATTSPRSTLEAQAFDRSHDAARGQEMDVQVLDLEQGRAILGAQALWLRFHQIFDDCHAALLLHAGREYARRARRTTPWRVAGSTRGTRMPLVALTSADRGIRSACDTPWPDVRRKGKAARGFYDDGIARCVRHQRGDSRAALAPTNAAEHRAVGEPGAARIVEVEDAADRARPRRKARESAAPSVEITRAPVSILSPPKVKVMPQVTA